MKEHLLVEALWESLYFIDIEINLLAQYFKPSKKFYERVLRGFLKTGLKFKFLFSAISKSDGKQLYLIKLVNELINELIS
jgi:hypothetical protein